MERPTKQAVKKRLLPLSSCENLGKSLKHPEAVYSSAKWTQKHLLCVLHGWWSEWCEKKYATEYCKTVKCSTAVGLDLCRGVGTPKTCLSLVPSSSSTKASFSAPPPRRGHWPQPQQTALEALWSPTPQWAEVGPFPPGSRVGNLHPMWMQQLLLICS